MWPDVLGEALRTAGTFVPILSPAYFSSQYCGKEWTAFARRLPARPVNPTEPGPVQPVLLVPPGDLHPMPPAVAAHQYCHDDYPDQYLERGLSYLLNVPSETDSYWKFLHAFAGKLIGALRSNPTSCAASLEPLAAIPSAFHDEMSHLQLIERGGPPSKHLFAEFVYIVARAEELRDLRQELSSYGDEGGLDWRPYLPMYDAEIGMIAAQVASRERFRYEPVPLDDHLVERVVTAAGARKVVVVVVDVWTVRIERYRKLMEDLDNRNVPACVIIVPVNFSDVETMRSQELLRATLEATFVNRHLVPDPDVFLAWVDTPEGLDARLADALSKAKMRILKQYEVTRRAQALGAFSRLPIIAASDRPRVW